MLFVSELPASLETSRRSGPAQISRGIGLSFQGPREVSPQRGAESRACPGVCQQEFASVRTSSAKLGFSVLAQYHLVR